MGMYKGSGCMEMLKHIVALLSLTLFVIAGDSQCNTGEIKCCTPNSTSSKAAEYVAQRGIVKFWAEDECSGAIVVGTSTGCSGNQEPVCCEKNTSDGVGSLGCVPINVNV
ncbi:uncharacterized protein EDB91DRAFT_1144122 [Suillus paluster]|uniref:uncharacterized protein n=1 Tax=Suillus paluster TaxID=48578 RepID=UPI001B87F878|nr:uncharacterized protein EDB91DRAFT_1144122 [Suillus paluster]KAG1735586.1 hypothetical protein EDB91DRAFT_1144122 [Suillus paluster]